MAVGPFCSRHHRKHCADPANHLQMLLGGLCRRVCEKLWVCNGPQRQAAVAHERKCFLLGLQSVMLMLFLHVVCPCCRPAQSMAASGYSLLRMKG